VQLTPSGELVVMLADHPTTGGYPVIAVVHPDDVDKLAQYPPGSLVSLNWPH
jgi:allophanate hydrolase subunit 2